MDPKASGGSTATAEPAGGGDPLASARLPGNEDPAPINPTTSPEPTPQTTTEPATPGSPVEAEPVEAVPGSESKPAEPALPSSAKVWAGQFKTPEEMEVGYKQNKIAYEHSSREGRRLATVLKEQTVAHEKTIAELNDKIAELSIMAEAGPEVKEPTDEELEALGPVKAMRLTQRIADRKAKIEALKQRKDAREREVKENEAKLRNHIDASIAEMGADAKNFPDFGQLQGAMSAILDMEPAMAGHANTPLIVYLAAYGRRALQRANEAATKTKESEDAAKAQARAAAAGAGAAGAAGTSSEPLPNKTEPEPDSDEAYNKRLVMAGKRHAVIL